MPPQPFPNPGTLPSTAPTAAISRLPRIAGHSQKLHQLDPPNNEAP